MLLTGAYQVKVYMVPIWNMMHCCSFQIFNTTRDTRIRSTLWWHRSFYTTAWREKTLATIQPKVVTQLIRWGEGQRSPLVNRELLNVPITFAYNLLVIALYLNWNFFLILACLHSRHAAGLTSTSNHIFFNDCIFFYPYRTDSETLPRYSSSKYCNVWQFKDFRYH